MTERDEAVDAFLAHYGVKGMKWGVRKERDGSSGSGTHKVFNKKNAAIAGGVLAIGGAITVGVLAKNGQIPMNAIQSNPQVKAAAMAGAKFLANSAKSAKKSAPAAASTARKAASKSSASAAAAQARRASQQIEWNARVKDLDNLIASAHAEQTLAMRKAMAAYGGTYNPRDNQFTPEFKRLQIGR